MQASNKKLNWSNVRIVVVVAVDVAVVVVVVVDVDVVVVVDVDTLWMIREIKRADSICELISREWLISGSCESRPTNKLKY